ncbi:MAG TPA: hypothetical protein VGZ71_10195 [Puia sp.]|jgi:hypothetical protein|nr:hypothetical protein [Puia sp.]
MKVYEFHFHADWQGGMVIVAANTKAKALEIGKNKAIAEAGENSYECAINLLKGVTADRKKPEVLAMEHWCI